MYSLKIRQLVIEKGVSLAYLFCTNLFQKIMGFMVFRRPVWGLVGGQS